MVRNILPEARGNAERAVMDSQLEKLKLALESAMEGVSDERLSWHPAEKWCAAEILEHLLLTYTGTIGGFEKVLARGRPLATRASLKHLFRTWVVVGFGHMPEGRKAPAATVPRGTAPGKISSEVAETIVAMDAVIAESENRFGRGVKLLDHPILGPLTATQWRQFHLVHGMHHRKQLLWLRDRTAR